MKRIRWICLFAGNACVLLGASICDFVYRPQWEHGALAYALCFLGTQWVITGMAIWNQKD